MRTPRTASARSEQSVRGTYDRDTAGQPAPVVEYTSKREAIRLFSGFSRAEVRREIQELELHREDAAVAGAGPDTARVDLLARYESAVLRKMDRALRALRDLQDARQQRGKGRADSGRNGRARR